MSNEIKVALLAIVSLLLAFWGYKFILGNNLLKKSNQFQVLYDDVQGLQAGTAVQINGVDVGSVTGLTLLENDEQQVLVELTLGANYNIPKQTDAVIVSDGIMGGKIVYLEYDRPCSGDACAESGDFLNGKVRGMLSSMMGTDDVGVYLKELRQTMGALVDTLSYKLLSDESDSPIAGSLRNLEATTANLQSATGQVDGLLRRSSGEINSAIANINALTAALEGKKQQMASIIANADSLSSQLVEADLRKTMVEVNKTIQELQQTIATADQALSGVAGTMERITNGEGTLGKLIEDDRLYNELRDLSSRTDSLMNDIQERPYRYVPFKGRKRVLKYDRKDAELEEEGGQ